MNVKTTSIILCVIMIVSLFSACAAGGQPTTPATTAATQATQAGQTTAPAEKEEVVYENALTIDVFSSVANYQGEQTGWYAKFIKGKFNITLNIIAPNVAGGGDTLYQTRTAAGELGDIIIVNSADGRIQELVTGGLLLDMTPYIADKENLNNYPDAIAKLQDMVEEDGIFGMPIEVSARSPDSPTELTQPGSGPYIRWELYKELGYPKIENLNDLLNVLEEMQKISPPTISGKPVYTLTLEIDVPFDPVRAAESLSIMKGGH